MNSRLFFKQYPVSKIYVQPFKTDALYLKPPNNNSLNLACVLLFNVHGHVRTVN